MTATNGLGKVLERLKFGLSVAKGADELITFCRTEDFEIAVTKLESLLGGWRPIEELDETVLPPPIRVFYFPRWLGSNSDYSGERWHGETTFDLKTIGRRKATMFYELPPPESKT